jgi:taurine dioxygenase
MKSDELQAIERLVMRTPRTYRTLQVHQITPIVGAEISGVNLAEPLSGEQLDEIKCAFLDHHVLVFRDQIITSADQKRFAGHFGELRPVNPPPDHGDPFILEVKTSPEAEYVFGNGWHADGTADAEPSLGSMLYITEVPEGGSGGDTLFANMHVAYELCSPLMRSLLEQLTAIHDGAQQFGNYPIPANYEPPVSEHPVVVQHPETGRKVLFVNPAYTSRIPQLADDESRSLLDMLFALIPNRPMLSCRIRWQPNTLVFWDNRCLQHNAIYDYRPLTRYGRRVAINGGVPKACMA